MKFTLRAKLAVIVLTAAVSFGLIAISGLVASARVTERLVRIREQYVPKISLRPRLDSEFERLRRAMQDAVAAQDLDALAQTLERRDRFFALLDESRGAIDPRRSAELRGALGAYYASAYDVSQRLIAGDTGEALVDAMGGMQRQQEEVRERIERTTALSEGELNEAFSGTILVQRTATRVLLLTSLVCLVLTIFLSWRVGSGVLRSVGDLRAGFARFGRGEFQQPIAMVGEDELAQAAASANEMAHSLQELSEERQRTEWLKAGLSGLADELRGELEVADVASRALRFLAGYLQAPVGALYCTDDGENLRRVATHAYSDGASATDDGPNGAHFRVGEGLVGQAAREASVTILRDPPAGYLRVRSGLGESTPSAIVFLPFAAVGRLVGVLELGIFRPWSEEESQFLMASMETTAIALQVAMGRGALRELLSATQQQAQRLAVQEEELRTANEELQTQQEELRQTNDELTRQAQELDAQRKAVEKKNTELEAARKGLELKAAELATVSAYKSQFLANMSHELRTPLNSMLLLSSLLSENQAGNLTPKQVEYCKNVYAAGTELLALINQVLDLSKIEAGKQELDVVEVPLSPMLAQLRAVFEPLANQKKLKLSLELDGDLPEAIRTDRQRIVQILTNLLGNAIKFTDRGEVKLRITPASPDTPFRRADLRADRTATFAVSDTGIGIRSEHRERIFEPFEQADPSSDRRHGGTGLGLAIAREIAGLLGGEIALTSTEGAGSTFFLHLPYEGPPSDVPPATTVPPERTVPPVGPAPLDPNVEPSLLIIEDDLPFANSLADLARRQGLKCFVAGDGESGLKLAKDHRPTGIVLDLGLPDISGWRVMERLRVDPTTASIPVHVVSALEPSERAHAMGAVGYLTKPCTKDSLVRMLESLLPKQQGQAMRLLVVEDDDITGDSLIAILGSEKVEVRRVASAEDALQALSTERFHCMVMDLSLPDMGGLELLQTIEKTGQIEKPAVIVYTARALSKAETQRLEAYAEAVVLKDGSSVERLRDEIRLFARQIAEGVPRTRTTRSAPSADTRLRGKTILVVDDDMRTVYALSAMLRSRGAEVVVADTGLAALAVLNDRTVDAVLMDIMMPEMDGYAAMRRIREDRKLAQLPILALTAKAMKGDEEKCIEAGATGYLPKPIDPQRLFEILGSYVTREG